MDEPTSALDFGNQARVLSRVLDLADKGIGVLLTTHNPEQAFTLGGDVVLVSRDKSCENGPVREVLTSEALSRTYGVDVIVRSFCHEGRNVDCCRALMGGHGALSRY